jgi:hypothetical protein
MAGQEFAPQLRAKWMRASKGTIQSARDSGEEGLAGE